MQRHTLAFYVLAALALLDGRGRAPGYSFAAASSSSSTTLVEQSLDIPLLQAGSKTNTRVFVTIAALNSDAVAGLDGPLAGILPSISSVEGGVAITLKPPPSLVSCKATTPSSSSPDCVGAAHHHKRLPLGPDGPMFSDEWEAAGVTARWGQNMRACTTHTHTHAHTATAVLGS